MTRTVLVAILATVTVLGLAGPSAAAAGQPPASYYGVHYNRVGDGLWPEARVGSIRLWDTHTSWKDLEPAKGQWRWDRLDTAVSNAEAHGAKVSLVLGETPPWASSRPHEPCLYGAGLAAPPARESDWVEYVYTVADRYRGRIESYEVWNEPNAGRIFWSGSVKQLARLARLARAAVRMADSRALMVSPSPLLRGGELGSWWLRRYAQVGGFRWADVVGVHNYPPKGRSVSDSMYGYDRARAVLARAGVRKPIWDTETNMETNTTPEPRLAPCAQARMLVDYYRLAWQHGVERVGWYDWSATSNIGVRLAVSTGSTSPSEAGVAFTQMQAR